MQNGNSLSNLFYQTQIFLTRCLGVQDVILKIPPHLTEYLKLKFWIKPLQSEAISKVCIAIIKFSAKCRKLPSAAERICLWKRISAGTFIVQQFKCRRFVTECERAVFWDHFADVDHQQTTKGIAPTKFQRMTDQSHQRNARGTLLAHLAAHSNRNIIKLRKPQNYREREPQPEKRQSPNI